MAAGADSESFGAKGVPPDADGLFVLKQFHPTIVINITAVRFLILSI